MERQRDGELVLIGEAFGCPGRPGESDPRSLAPSGAPLHPLRSSEPALSAPTKRTRTEVSLARTMALCSLPRTNPGNRIQYQRVNGPFKLVMYSSGETKLGLEPLQGGFFVESVSDHKKCLNAL